LTPNWGCPAPNAANFKAYTGEDRVRLEVKLDIKVEKRRSTLPSHAAKHGCDGSERHPADLRHQQFVSPSDPAAQWTGAMRGPAFFAYADNDLIDVKFGIIMDVEATRAIRQAEVGAAKKK